MRIPEKSPDMASVTDSGPIRVSADAIRLAGELNGRYLHWDDLRYRDLGAFSMDEVWRLMKIARITSCRKASIPGLDMSYCLLDYYTIDALRRIDSRMSAGIVPGDLGRMSAMLAVSSVMEESIASSQIEGASTTAAIAKRMLRTNAEPRDRSERMILNNYRAMQLIKGCLDEPLSPELIMEIHRTMTDGLMEDPGTSGRFREDDSIAIRDVYEDITYHVPAPHDRIAGMVDGLCAYANDDSDGTHPLIKAMVIHYALAHIHPFLDGNGRVSRSLFYWFCLRNGYSMMEYLSVSRMIREHRRGYDMAFLLSETDGEDITYFIRFNLKMIEGAMDAFDAYLRRKAEERTESMLIVDDRVLSQRQSQMIGDMMRSGAPMSQYELSMMYQTPVPTIRRDIVKLMEMGLVRIAGKDGHKMLYEYCGRRREPARAPTPLQKYIMHQQRASRAPSSGPSRGCSPPCPGRRPSTRRRIRCCRSAPRHRWL